MGTELDTEDLYRIRWRDGWKTLTYLYRHPDDTTAIARLIEAMQGRSIPRLLNRLRQRRLGRTLLSERPSLRKAINDHAWLRSLPEGSLGRAYLEHYERAQLKSGMSTYLDEGTDRERTSKLPADEQYIQDFVFHSHDLYHLVAGYQTDLVGEVCLLAFTAGQTRNVGIYAMSFLGLYSLRLPWLRGQRLAAQALVRALKARWLVEQNWVELLPKPLEEVQKTMRLYPPPKYEPLYVGKGKSRRRREAMERAARAGRTMDQAR